MYNVLHLSRRVNLRAFNLNGHRRATSACRVRDMQLPFAILVMFVHVSMSRAGHHTCSQHDLAPCATVPAHDAAPTGRPRVATRIVYGVRRGRTMPAGVVTSRRFVALLKRTCVQRLASLTESESAIVQRTPPCCVSLSCQGHAAAVCNSRAARPFVGEQSWASHLLSE